MLKKYKEELTEYVKNNQKKLNGIFADSWNDISSKDEIHQLKDFLLKENVGIKYINDQLNKIINDYFSIRFNAVFSHSSPKVSFEYQNESISRELADLLVILRINEYSTESKTLYSSSFLSQWKLNHNDNQNKGQEYLYDFAADFSMPMWIAGQNVADRKRLFDNRTSSLNFFYLDDRTFLKRPAGRPSLSFSQLLINLLSLNYGLKFDNNVWTNNIQYTSNWSRIMDDLINKVGRTRNIRGTEQPKLIEYLISSEPYYYHIDNEGIVDNNDKRFQSTLIIDINFSRKLKVKEILK
jgi:hypothetical protein